MKGDILAGVIIAAFGFFVMQQARALEYAGLFGPGPGFIPFWVGLGLVLLAVILIAAAVRTPQSPGAEPAGGATVKVLASWAALMASIALLKHVGFLISFGLLTFFLVYLIDRRSLGTAAVVGIASLAGFYLVFGAALGLALPQGPWGF